MNILRLPGAMLCWLPKGCRSARSTWHTSSLLASSFHQKHRKKPTSIHHLAFIFHRKSASTMTSRHIIVTTQRPRPKPVGEVHWTHQAPMFSMVRFQEMLHCRRYRAVLHQKAKSKNFDDFHHFGFPPAITEELWSSNDTSCPRCTYEHLGYEVFRFVLP